MAERDAGSVARYNVGIDPASDAGVEAAESLAAAVHNRLELGDVRTVVTGSYTDAAVDQLRTRDDVDYVERDEEMEAL